MKTLKSKKIGKITIILIALFAATFNTVNAQTIPKGWNMIFAHREGSSDYPAFQVITKDSVYFVWKKPNFQTLQYDTIMVYTSDGGQNWDTLTSNFDKHLITQYASTPDWTKFPNIGVIKLFPANKIMYALTVNEDLIKTTTNGLYAYDKEKISYVTVDSTGYNKIVWKSTPNVGIVSYNVYKLSNTSVYNKIASVPYVVGELSYTDNSSNPAAKSDFYKISITDTNTWESTLSDSVKTMHVAINGSEIIFTDKPVGFVYSSFYIYKGSDSTALHPYDTIPSAVNGYTDLTPNKFKGNAYYKVGVIVPSVKKYVTMAFSNMVKKDLGAGVNDVERNVLTVNIYPNPTTDVLNISLNDVKSVQIYNYAGSVVLESNLNNIDVSDLSNGMYFLKAVSGDKVYKGKFIKE